MIHSDGAQYNFDRIMRVTLYDTKGSVGNQEAQFYQFEYCPLDTSGIYNARIDAVIDYRPNVTVAEAQDGFSGKVTLYNVGSDVLEFVGRHTKVITDMPSNAELDAYYASRIWVTVEAGYWEPELGKGKERNYARVYTGYLNTSALYRKGVDTILSLQCFSRQPSSVEAKHLIKKDSDIKSINVKTNNTFMEDRFNNSTNTTRITGPFEYVAKEIIKSLCVQKIPERSAFGRFFRGTHPVDVERSDRARDDWIAIHYISEPDNKIEPEKSEQVVIDPKVTEDQTLSDFLRSSGNASVLIPVTSSPNASMFVSAMNELCAYYGLAFMESLTNAEDNKTHFYFWPTGEGVKIVTPKGEVKERVEIPVEPKEVLHIRNYQNLLEVPTIDGSGRFTIKMMFNDAMVPGKKLQLDWDDDVLTANAQISPSTQGVNVSAGMAAMWPLLQAGRYNNVIAGVAENNGDVFNRPFGIMHVTHTLSTHTDKWQTEARTTPGDV